ncbi:1-phosphofructokinase family hexose kinase [Sphaerimonospora thailandensis]|uniref:Sugar kinase n=1 Tax=Sphaerimonospora thailandensis TaxID=795644 RepID=A0A8J3RCH3_9ACTN|nr:1-phosphofructokinase family hexose kinase [Sphaerimonospora thailandensis]GIH71337.1 sugar kinase [Sphaerimonospora thailandensis]
MILTVTLNAALDVTYEVAELVPGGTHRASAVHERAGGKGVNVARVLTALGRDRVLATGLAGGPAGAEITRELAAAGIPARFAPIAGDSRRTVTIVASGDATVFNEPGPVVTDGEWHGFRERFRALCGEAEVAVLSGSLPPGVPRDAYAQLTTDARARGVRVLLDADGEALRLGLAARPDVAKPNAAELARVAGPGPVAEAARSLLANGPGAVVVSRGADGLLAVTSAGTWSVRPPRPLSGNPTGAGDAVAAALARALRGTAPLDRAAPVDWPAVLADAAALSAAAVLAPVAGDVDLAAYRTFLQEISCHSPRQPR